jgi:hypothetical protein
MAFAKLVMTCSTCWGAFSFSIVVAWAPAIPTNKGDGLSLASRWWPAWCLSSSIWTRWRVLKSFVGDLYWVIDALRLLDRMRFSRTHSCFVTVRFEEGVSRSFTICQSWDMFFEILGEFRGGECHSAGGVRTSNDGSSLRGDKNLLGNSWLVEWHWQVRRRTGEVQSLIFQDDNPRFDLN